MHPFLPGEEIISQSSNTILTLTNKRVVYAPKGWNDTSRDSILLEDIVICKHDYNINSLYLIIGILIICYSLNSPWGYGLEVIFTPLFILGIFAILHFFYSLRNSIVIASHRKNIRVPVRGMERKQLYNFLEEVDRQSFRCKYETMNAQ